MAWSRGEGVLEATPRGSLPPARSSRSPMPTLVDADTLPGDSLSTLRKNPPRRYALALGLVGALAVGGALISWRQRSTPLGPETTAAALSRQPGAATHSLTILGLPSGARVLLDDAPVTLPTALRGEGDHRVRVEVDGAPAWMAVVPRPTADVSLAYVAPAAVTAAAVDAGAPTPVAPVARAVTRRAVARRADAGRATPGTLLARDPGF